MKHMAKGFAGLVSSGSSCLLTWCKECFHTLIFKFCKHANVQVELAHPRSLLSNTTSIHSGEPHEFTAPALHLTLPAQCCGYPVNTCSGSAFSSEQQYLSSRLLLMPGIPPSYVQCYDPCMWGLLYIVLWVSVWALLLVHMLWKNWIALSKSCSFWSLKPFITFWFSPRNNTMKIC